MVGDRQLLCEPDHSVFRGRIGEVDRTGQDAGHRCRMQQVATKCQTARPSLRAQGMKWRHPARTAQRAATALATKATTKT